MIIKALKDKPSSMFSFQGLTPKGNLVLVFTDSTAKYVFKVDAETKQNFLDADSRGRFFLSNIKGKFEFQKV